MGPKLSSSSLFITSTSSSSDQVQTEVAEASRDMMMKDTTPPEASGSSAPIVDHGDMDREGDVEEEQLDAPASA